MTDEQVSYIITLHDNFSKKLELINSRTKKTDGVISRFGGNIRRMFAGVGIAMAGSKIIKMIADHEQAMAELSSITGLTGKDLDAMGMKAGQLSKQFGTSSTEILKSMAIVGSKAPQLLGNADALAEVTRQVDIMSKASGMDGVQSADALTKAMNIFGLSADRAAYVNDVFATSAQKGTAPINALADAMVNVGPAARAMGYSFEDTNILLQQLAAGGMEGVDAGTKLKMVLSQMAATGQKELNPRFTSLKDIMKNLAKQTNTTDKAMALFGKDSWAVGKILTDQIEVVDRLNGKLNETGTALSMAETNTNTLKGSWEELSGAFDGFINNVVNGKSEVSNFFKGIVDGAKSTVDYLSKIMGTFEQTTSAQADEVVTKLSDRVNSMVNMSDKKKAIDLAITEYQDIVNRMQNAYSKSIKSDYQSKFLRGFKLLSSSGASMFSSDFNVNYEKSQFDQAQKTLTKLRGLKDNLGMPIGTSGVTDPTDPSNKKLTDYTKITAAAPKVFNINIENLVENFAVNTNTMNQTSESVKKQIIETFMEAINDVQILANS